AKDNPVLPPGPVEVDNHRDAREHQDPCRRDEHAHAYDLSVLRELGLPASVTGASNSERERWDDEGAADPNSGRDDVNRFEERVPSHASDLNARSGQLQTKTPGAGG